MCHLSSSPGVPLLFFHISSQLEDPKPDDLYQVHWGEEENNWSVGWAFIEAFRHTVSPVSSGEFSSVHVHFVRTFVLSKRARCSVPAYCHQLQDWYHCLFPWGSDSNSMCNHELVQEEAKQAQWDLDKSDRLGIWWWIQKNRGWETWGSDSRKRRRSAPSSGSSANCRKTQPNQLYLRIKYLHISFSCCPATVRVNTVTLFCK